MSYLDLQITHQLQPRRRLSPLACLLVGQPTLRRSMRLGVLAALVISSLN